MRVAALYDVHGMPWPLEAVLDEVDADEIVYGGDLLDGPFPERVLELAEGHMVRGNCERVPSDWDRARVAAEDLRRLAALPLTVSLDGVLYCHATPDDDMPQTTVFTPDETVAERFAGIDERTAVIGHTHLQFDRRVGDLRVVNAGSVGLPFEHEVAAYWALVVDGEPELRRTPFEVERAGAEVLASGWPPAAEFVAENLRLG